MVSPCVEADEKEGVGRRSSPGRRECAWALELHAKALVREWVVHPLPRSELSPCSFSTTRFQYPLLETLLLQAIPDFHCSLSAIIHLPVLSHRPPLYHLSDVPHAVLLQSERRSAQIPRRYTPT